MDKRVTAPLNAATGRDERARRARQKEIEAQAAMQEYREEQAAIDANTARLRALRLAKEAEKANADPVSQRATPKKRVPRRGVGSL